MLSDTNMAPLISNTIVYSVFSMIMMLWVLVVLPTLKTTDNNDLEDEAAAYASAQLLHEGRVENHPVISTSWQGKSKSD